MFFNKEKNPADSANVQNKTVANPYEELSKTVSASAEASQPNTAGSSYAFYKPNPYPKELVSVLKSMLQRLFPDTKKAYLLEAQHFNKKGYLLIVDIDSKFLKIINIYLDSETKRVRGDVPIECVLYSKSGSLTEGMEPFLIKESAESKANNLASKEFSGDVAFSEMPEFDLWSSKKDKKSEEESSGTNASNEVEEAADKDENVPSEPVLTETESKAESAKATPVAEKKEEASAEDAGTAPVKIDDKTKVKPSTKKELFGLLNQYGAKKSGAVSTVAMAAIKEYEFYIPYTYNKAKPADSVDASLPINEDVRFKKLINPDDGTMAVPLFTEKSDALTFASKDGCRIVYLKYKDFASSRAAELTGHSGIIINPDCEALFLASTHPLLG